MKNAENVPPVYEIIWICDAKYEQLAQGQSRFFSTGKGTDAEQEKVKCCGVVGTYRLPRLTSLQLLNTGGD